MPLDGVSTEEIDALNEADRYTIELALWRLQWLDDARANQLPPVGDWDYWLILAGRGFGKTRVGAEETGYFAAKNPGVRCAVVAPTQNDVRSVCFEGESGLLAKIPAYFIKKYNSTDLEIELINGSLIIGKSAEKPDRLRGPQWHFAWCDELASWGAGTAEGPSRKKKGEAKRLKDTWDNLLFGLRLGKHPRVIITTTPRPLDFLRNLVKDVRCVVSRGSTFDNAKNLAKAAIDTFRRIYEGTRRGMQELHAEILDTNEHALWKPDQLEALRVKEMPAGVSFLYFVLAIDPAVTTEDDSDETGIVGAGLGDDGIIYVVHDLSGHYSPRTWARLALSTYEREAADCIVSETNQGGDLVEANLRAEADGVIFAYRGVHAKRGKYLRAEPVSAYYEKRKVRHVGHFPELEKQMCGFTGSTADGSPDRLDALVYAVGELMSRTVKHAFW